MVCDGGWGAIFGLEFFAEQKVLLLVLFCFVLFWHWFAGREERGRGLGVERGMEELKT